MRRRSSPIPLLLFQYHQSRQTNFLSHSSATCGKFINLSKISKTITASQLLFVKPEQKVLHFTSKSFYFFFLNIRSTIIIVWLIFCLVINKLFFISEGTKVLGRNLGELPTLVFSYSYRLQCLHLAV